ncbi:hypothetical protein [Paenibacillus antri]|uniref:hypothetical protein n=1 Tax=Paenibacillus antri TaxID=2582848 RepID=UPI0013050CDE|nr:hypothetical protein [Paenibacillus antri]
MTDRRKPPVPGKPFVQGKPIVPGKAEEDPRKITYRVGWKSGTIHMQDKGKARPSPSGGTLSDFAPGGAPKPATREPEPAPTAERLPAERLAKLLLRPAPLPPAKAWPYLLSCLPAAAFAVLVWLAYRMTTM